LAAYDEVRVWRGVLTDAQLAASAAAGPDAAIAAVAEGVQFTAPAAPEPPAQRAAVPNGGFRLMTYNIRYCYDEVSTIVPDCTAARIIAENPDFCCVNEVRDSESHPEATLLAKLTGMHKSFGGNDSRSNGNLILSREKPIGSETVFLQMSSAGWGNRYCHICEFTNFCVAVTHLDTARESSRNAEVQASNAVAIATIRDAFAKYTKPVFLCGDWNTRPDWENMERFNEFLTILSPTNGVRTYHGDGSSRSILDYISVDTAHAGDFFVQNAYVVEDRTTSDHAPVTVELYHRPAASDLGWMDESLLSTGRTGTWAPAITWDSASGSAELGGDYSFTPFTPSEGNSVTVTVVVAFDAVPMETDTPDAASQGAIWLGTNGCFQVWTRLRQGSGGQAGWIDVEADGVTPATGVDYTFRVIFDYISKTYGVEVRTGLTGFARLREKNPVNPENPLQNFPLATTATAVSEVRFSGDGVFTSLFGEYVAVAGFSAAETVILKNNASVVLDAAKAKWLNSCAGGKAAVGSAAAGLSAREFADAYLLNLDITEGGRSYAFAITSIDVGAESVTVAVKLTRSGNIAQSINGTLKFYGAATLDAFKNPALQPLSSATVSDSDFSEGDTATAAFPKADGSAVNTFFKAKIEER
jgi:endonuclease/exonuclease/phosphatase family metal-dependent hydrolase